MGNKMIEGGFGSSLVEFATTFETIIKHFYKAKLIMFDCSYPT
jgi:hypothetical protein